MDKVLAEFSAGFISGEFSQEQADLVNWLEQKKPIDWGTDFRIAEFRKKANRSKSSSYPNGMPPPWGVELTMKVMYTPASLQARDKVMGLNLVSRLARRRQAGLAKVWWARTTSCLRVMVNAWHYMFGRGIVPTTDDFGPMGQVPSNSQLLDWLAADFMETIGRSSAVRGALSYTYRQSSKETLPILSQNR